MTSCKSISLSLLKKSRLQASTRNHVTHPTIVEESAIDIRRRHIDRPATIAENGARPLPKIRRQNAGDVIRIQETIAAVAAIQATEVGEIIMVAMANQVTEVNMIQIPNIIIIMTGKQDAHPQRLQTPGVKNTVQNTNHEMTMRDLDRNVIITIRDKNLVVTRENSEILHVTDIKDRGIRVTNGLNRNRIP